MSLEDEPSPDFIVDAMAERPLALEDDVRHLHETTDRLNVEPAAMIDVDGEERAVAIRIVDRHERVVHLYGYSPAASTWTLAEEWTEITPENYHDAVDRWIDRYGREQLADE